MFYFLVKRIAARYLTIVPHRACFSTKYFSRTNIINCSSIFDISVMSKTNPKNNNKRLASLSNELHEENKILPKKVIKITVNKSNETKSLDFVPSVVSINNSTSSLPTSISTITTSPEIMIKTLDTPDKSQSDKKDYRIIKLPNGLTALLVSDPSLIEQSPTENDDTEKKLCESSVNTEDEESNNEEAEEEEEEESDENSDDDEANCKDENKSAKEKLAACSLTIDVGSFSDPRHVQGLAHFLEHMIFMGSEKYPSENEYDLFIQKCGGSDNAYTNCEETQFYFEIGEEHLDGAFDRFASLFKRPLLLKDAMSREREAVESEFQMHFQDDEVRKEQLLGSVLGTPDHPSSIFMWGNLKTLKDEISDDDLYAAVHEFKDRHYSANRMYLCCQARLSLDALQELVVKHFADVPTNNLPADDFSHFKASNAFLDTFSTKVILIKPITNIRKLELNFRLDPVLKDYEAKSHQFLAFILGHEGTGSLSAYLRENLYAVDLVAGTESFSYESNSLFCLFGIAVHLTQKGFENINAILSAIFSYIRFLQISQVHLKESLFREVQTVEENTFRFQTDQTSLENVEEFGVALKYYPPKQVLTGESLYFQYDPIGIEKLVNNLNSLERMNIIITTSKPMNGMEFNLTEQWFGTEYCTIDLPAVWKELWTNAKPLKEFALPVANPFIATDFHIKYSKDKQLVQSRRDPVKIYENNICELWHRQDDRFLLPIAYYYIYFMNPMVKESVENQVMMAMYPLILKFKLIDQIYPATVAALGADFYTSDKGLVLKVNGFNQNIDRLIEIIAKAFVTFANDLTEDQFKSLVEQKLRGYYNGLLKPKSLAKILRLGIIENHFIQTKYKFEYLKTLKLEQFRQFTINFLSELRIQALCQGNIEPQEAKQIMENCLTTIKSKPVENPAALNLLANQIPNGSTYLRCKTMNTDDSNTVTINYYQIGPITIRTNCLIDLLMIIMEEPLFDTLRSKEQLGYDVNCQSCDNFGILGYTINVQSQETKFTAQHIDERIELFRNEFVQRIENYTIDDFEQFKESLIKLKLSDDNHLKDEVIRNWAEVTTDEYLFSRRYLEVDCLKTITHKDFVEFYLTQLTNNKLRKISYQVIGSKNEGVSGSTNTIESIFNVKIKDWEFVPLENVTTTANITEIQDIDKFKASLVAYPVSKTITK